MTGKLLTLIRHANAAPRRGPRGDSGRSLDARGEVEAQEMRRRLAARGVRPDRLVASTALRAGQTADIVGLGMGIGAERVERSQALYAASTATLLELVRGLPDELGHVALVGHNPGLSDLCGWLTDERMPSLPTCGAVRLELMVEHWSDADRGCALRRGFDCPRLHDARSEPSEDS